MILPTDLECDDLASSTAATILPSLDSFDGFAKLMDCLKYDMGKYAASSQMPDLNFVVHHKSDVMTSLHQSLIPTYDRRLAQFGKKSKYRLSGVRYNFVILTKSVSPPLTPLESGSLITSIVEHLFFSFEYACKIICGLGDEVMAKQVAADSLIYHDDVFNCLKRLCGENFSLNFAALCGVYAYAIRARMLADYSELFYEQASTWGYIGEVFYPTVEAFSRSSRDLMFECRGI